MGVLAAVAGGAGDVWNWPALLTGAGGVLTALLAYLGGRRGQDIERRDEKAGRVLEGRGQAFEQMDKVLVRLEAENERLLAAQEREAAGRERDRDAARAEVKRIEARCARQVERLVDVITTLRDVTRDEIAREAAKGAIDAAAEHTGDVHVGDVLDAPDGAP